MLGAVERCIERCVAERPGLRPLLANSICLDVTNRRIDGHLYLVFDAAGRDPLLVAKTARTSGGRRVFDVEYENLRRLHDGGMNADWPTTPEPLGRQLEAGVLVTVQAALRGTLMKNVRGRTLFGQARVDETLGRVHAWLMRLARLHGIERARLDAARYERTVLEPVRRFERRYRLEPAERAFLQQRFERERCLLDSALPFTVRHGDFCPANVILDSGRIGVLDWEFPLRPEPPLFDLFHFLASTRYPYQGLRGESSHFDSFVAVYWDDNDFAGAARRWIARACEELALSHEHLGDLFLLALVEMANLKFDGLLGAHEMQEPDTEPDDDAGKRAIWAAFDRPHKTAPFARIQDGVYHNLRHVVHHGLPRF